MHPENVVSLDSNPTVFATRSEELGWHLLVLSTSRPGEAKSQDIPRVDLNDDQAMYS